MSGETGGVRRVGFKPIVQVACGNFLEMYDFMVFGYYAKAIAAAFFPVRASDWPRMAVRKTPVTLVF